MTYEEAIKCINNVLNSDYHYDESLGYQLTSDDFEWLDLAIEALEKQIPKKPVWERLGDSLSNADIITMCPCCYKGIEEDEHHCECGQLIDWGE